MTFVDPARPRDASRSRAVPSRASSRLAHLHRLFWLSIAVVFLTVPVLGLDRAERTSAQTPTPSLTPAATPEPCVEDADCDGVPDLGDNCPAWPNANQGVPPWPVPIDDPDCDGFSTAVENSAGTAAQAHCGANAWPADINNDGFSDVSDITALGGSFGKPVPPATTSPPTPSTASSTSPT